MFDAAVCNVEGERTFDVSALSRAGPSLSRSKRLLDIIVAVALLMLLTPVFLAIAICIRAESKGPVFFRQHRGGLRGRAFAIYKFRTMVVMENGDQVVQARKQDSRITAFGALLRKTSMDELPQLINVLRGQMSLVGPRPHAVSHDREFQERLPVYVQRFAAKPGMTGLAQVRGFRGETLTAESLEMRVLADLEYIERWSLIGDLRLLLATLKVPLDRRAY